MDDILKDAIVKVILTVLHWQITWIIATAVFVFTYYDSIEKILARLTGMVSFLGVFLERAHLSFDIQSKINIFSKLTFDEIKIKERPQVKVNFVKTTSPEAFLKDNQIIVHMDCSENKNRNLCLATILYVSKSVLPNIRKYLSSSLDEALNLMLTKKIIHENGTREEKDFFHHVVLKPKCDQLQDLNKLCEKIHNIDEKGYFTRLFLRELYFLGPTMGECWPTDEVKKEIEDFLNYIEKLSHTPLVEAGGALLKANEFSYTGKFIRARVVLFANRAKMQLSDAERPYLKRFKQGLQTGANVIYLIGREDSIQFIKKFEREIHNRLVLAGIVKLIARREYKIPSGNLKGSKHICAVYRTNKSLQKNEYDDLFKDIEEVAYEDSGTEEMMNNRQFPRLTGQALDATLTVIESNEAQKCKALDLSTGGVCLDAILEQGTEVSAILQLTDGSQIKVKGNVVWKNEVLKRVGLQFNRFNADNRHHYDRLNAYIDTQAQSLN